ncbi:unnamed protein product [Withania somnifera]
MKIKLDTWNVRGLNNIDKRRLVKNSLLVWGADIICLQETKLEGDVEDIVKQIWGGRWTSYACLEASGTRGQNVMIWNRRVWKGDVLQIGVHSFTCRFEGQLQDFRCHITGVYAPNLSAVRDLMEGPWAICGDFNIVRFPTKKRNFKRRSIAMVEFYDFIKDMNLIDLQLEGEWDDSFSNIKRSLLQRVTSDHIPVVLQCGDWDQQKSYFKFDNWWLNTQALLTELRVGGQHLIFQENLTMS